MAFYQLSPVQHSRYRLLLPGEACKLSLQKLHDIFSRKGTGDKLADVFVYQHCTCYSCATKGAKLLMKDIFLLFETTRSMPGSGRFSLS